MIEIQNEKKKPQKQKQKHKRKDEGWNKISQGHQAKHPNNANNSPKAFQKPVGTTLRCFGQWVIREDKGTENLYSCQNLICQLSPFSSEWSAWPGAVGGPATWPGFRLNG